jgi:hypothetical protein
MSRIKTCQDAIELLMQSEHDNQPEYWIAMRVLLNEKIRLSEDYANKE